MYGLLRLSALALVLCVAGRRLASAAVTAKPGSNEDSWSLITSPFGPGVWLVGPNEAAVAHAFIPPGAKAFHDESDQTRRGWRHLTVDADLSMRPTVTKLDTHEVFSMVPSAWRGWVMEQSIRYSDGSIRGADLLQSVLAMGVKPQLLDRALRALGREQRPGIHRAAVRATYAAVEATHSAVEATQAAVDRLPFGAQRTTGDSSAPINNDDRRRDPSPWQELAGASSTRAALDDD